MKGDLELAYIGIEIEDVRSFESLLRDVVGLIPGKIQASATSTWRNDRKSSRVILHAGPSNDAVFLGLEARDASAYDSTLERLESIGAEVRPGTVGQTQERGVERLAVTHTPWNLQLEIVLALEQSDDTFQSRVSPCGFVTDGVGFGHAVFGVEDLDEAHRFFVEGLGFAQSDWLEVDANGFRIVSRFYHCNSRHHSVALAGVPFPLPTHLHHIMFESPSADEVGHAYDRAFTAGMPIASGLGKHENDRMFSFYVTSPAGIQIEVGNGARVIDDAWADNRKYTEVSAWGHQPIVTSSA
jgi:biphenyl-2,3-diol 1,2-dioxygenase